MTQLAEGVRAYVIIGLIAALAAIAGIFTMPPIDRDESRYAQATSQMLETGDLINIRFMDEARNKKPAGIYWMQAATVWLVSDVEDRQIWAYRIPSVLGVIMAALACFWGGIRLVGREAAFAGSALFAASMLLGFEGGIAKTDAMLAGATTLSLSALANLRSGDGGWRTSMIFWFGIGLGLLIKGPITPMVAGLTLIALAIWERRLNWMKPLLFIPGPLLAIAIFVPWFLAIQHATGGDFLRESLGQDMLGKVGDEQERHGGLPGYYLLLLPLFLFPATLFLGQGIGRVWSTLRLKIDNHAADAARFLVCWVVPTWLVFELTSTKLPHYVLPTYPALALIAGWGLMQTTRESVWPSRISFGLFGFATVVWAILVPGMAIMWSNTASWDAVMLSQGGFHDGFQFAPDPAALATVLAGAIIFVMLAMAAMMSQARGAVLALVLAVSAGLGWHVMARTTALPNAEAVRLADRIRAARDDFSEQITGVPAGEIVTASSYTEPSLVFSLGSDTMLGTADEVLAFAESREEPTMLVLDLSRDEAWKQFLTLPGGLGFVDLQMRTSQFEQLEICSATSAAGTNYSRGDDTVIAIMFSRCGGARPDDRETPSPEPEE